MPYHAEAVGRGWADVEPAFQLLILALLKVSGAGFLAVGITLIALLLLAYRRRDRWARWAIPAIGLVY